MLPLVVSTLLAQCCGCWDGGTIIITEPRGNMVSDYLTARTAVQATLVTPGTSGRAISVLGHRNPGDTGSSADVVLGSVFVRAPGLRLVDFGNGGQVVAQVNSEGTVVAGINQGSGNAPSFVSSGGSGHIAMTVGDGLYLPLSGQLPSGYGGRHGAVAVTNSRPMDAGYVFEANNGRDGMTSKVLMVNHQGGLSNLGGLSLSTFMLCPAEADEGALQFSKSDGHWYTCKSDGWKQMTEAPQTDALTARILALEARVTVLEQRP